MRPVTRRPLALALALVLFGSTLAPVSAAAASLPPMIGPVTDEAGVLGSGTASVAQAISALSTAVGIHLHVIVAATTGGATAESLAQQAFHSNALGVEDMVLLTAVDTQSYGWWQGGGLTTVPPADINAIADQTLVPHFKAADYVGGLTSFTASFEQLLIARGLARQSASPAPVGSTLTPASAAAASGWTVSLSSRSHVAAYLLGDPSGPDVTLAMSNQTDITPFGSATAAAILDALGFGGGYSQEASWPEGADPSVACPSSDLPFTCRPGSRALLIPGSVQAFLAFHGNATGMTTVEVAPDEVSLALDVSTAAVGMALEALTGAPSLRPDALDVASLALQLSPAAVGVVTALLHHDQPGALAELVALAKQAAQAIIAHAERWVEATGISLALNLLPAVLEVRLGIAAAQAVVVLANLDVALLSGHAGTGVAVGYGRGAEAGTAQAVVAYQPPTKDSFTSGIAEDRAGNMWVTEPVNPPARSMIARIGPSGIFTEFPVPDATSSPTEITAGPDGNIWYVASGTVGSIGFIGRVTPAGAITEWVIPWRLDTPWAISSGTDGNLWFSYWGGTGVGHDGIGRVTPSGQMTQFLTPTADSQPQGITLGPDGNVWFTEFFANKIGRITPTGTITEFPIPGGPPYPQPWAIAAGPDGNLWFTAWQAIGRMTLSGQVTEFPCPTDMSPSGITAGPDGAMWFGALVSHSSLNGGMGGQVPAVGHMTVAGDGGEMLLSRISTGGWADIARSTDGAMWIVFWGQIYRVAGSVAWGPMQAGATSAP